MRPLILRASLALLLTQPGCSADEASTTDPGASCKAVSFRACELTGCRGVQQCRSDGRGFGPCRCTLFDGALPIAPDAELPDAMTDGSFDAEASSDGALDGTSADDAAGDGPAVGDATADDASSADSDAAPGDAGPIDAAVDAVPEAASDAALISD